MKQPYRALCWTALPYAVWTVVVLSLWLGEGSRVGLLIGSTLLGLPFSMVGAVLVWTFGWRTDDGVLTGLLLGGWTQYVVIGWFVGRAVVQRQVRASLVMMPSPNDREHHGGSAD